MIDAHSARIAETNCLVLPILDFDQRLWSLQFVAPDGQKKLFPDGRKRGCHIPVAGSLESNAPLAICERFSTACTVAIDHPGSCTIAAIDCHNLRAVSVGARVKWLDRKITIFADDDRHSPTNPGRSSAVEAARVAGCGIEFPRFPEGAPNDLTDFNDLHCWLARGSLNG